MSAPSPGPGDGTVDAVRAYKDVVAELSAAAEALRERERLQVVALKRRLDELDAVRAATEERAALARLAVELHWDVVLARLWHEAWMTLRARLDPDLGA